MRGVMYTIEAVIAVLMVLVILYLILQNPPARPEFTEINYKTQAYNGIKILERTGKLRRFVLNNDTTSIKTRLTHFISHAVEFDVVLFNKTSNITTIPSIDADDVVTISYFLAGDVGNYVVREVRIYLWGFE